MLIHANIANGSHRRLPSGGSNNSVVSGAVLLCSAAEFIIYKLKELGKINQEDIALVMEEFDDLDVNQSGLISASDLLAQSDQ